MKKKTKKWVITFIILDSLAIICLFLFYGPFTFIKDFLVTNAISTMSHKYIARTFYTDSMIAEVMNRNKVIDGEENTDTSVIKIGEIKEQTTYSSIYEEQILKKDKDNDLYKIITIEEDGYKAFLAVIYDPSRVELASSSNRGKQKIDEIAKENDAKIAINGSGYLFGPNRTKIPTGAVIMDGKIVYDNDAVGGRNGGMPDSCNVTYDELRGWIENGAPVFAVWNTNKYNTDEKMVEFFTGIEVGSSALDVYYQDYNLGKQRFTYKSDGSFEPVISA